jgi:hypothetical protein
MADFSEVNGPPFVVDVDGGKAMVFIPKSVSSQAPVLVYYHGYTNTNDKAHGQHSIGDYIAWTDTDPHHRSGRPQPRDLRPLLKDKKVVLVEPWGGQRSNFGHLGYPLDPVKLIAAAAAMLKDLGGKASSRPLILAGFSGGGSALKKAVSNLRATPSFSSLTDVWCFDCMYSDKDKDGKSVDVDGRYWLKWAQDNPSKKVHVCLSTGGGGKGTIPLKEAEYIQAGAKSLTNIEIIKKDTNHEALPGMCIQDW